MAQMFSTYDQDVNQGRIFSTSRTTVISPPGGAPRVPVAPAVRPVSAPVTEFLLSNQAFLNTPLCAPGALAHQAAGVAKLQGNALTAELSGLAGQLPAGAKLTGWLLHDLTIPTDIDPRDLALLPHGLDGRGNQPGSVFTLDGNAPGVGAGVNTVALAVPAGDFALAGDKATVSTSLTPAGNVTFDPRVMLGAGAIADLTATLPSAVTARILSDVFLRPATVLPELSIQMHFGQRLIACTQAVLAELDKNGDGRISAEEATADMFLQPDAFRRVAVTVEPVTKPIPLLPTQTSCILVGTKA